MTDETEHYFDWLGAGYLDLTRQQTAMFQGDRIGKRIFFGFGREAFYLRLDLLRQPDAVILRFILPRPSRVTIRGMDSGAAEAIFASSTDGVSFTDAPAEGLFAQWKRTLLVSVPRQSLGVEGAHDFSFFVQLLEGGLQRERYPERGAIEIKAPGPDFEAEQWYV